ncbi:MAG: maltose ABC transporter substrate-binding protein [Acidimicrobiia bacterium]|nr:maltose ABC transporter substrate-binding protein [Acidimicrobiia bacterium]MBT8193835.1 maltose ABC transporter substrate-binding protein [Acidimicrobiia bacterium]MBT8248290.1 maltose ABC transporter substrate-binding protein [Acidimicrobiia bacterium]NNF88649.1 maltose ABC transporter substrate-binding protein [Acidimicrobiia bacterium]NNJ47209.1 maltose ABC transporter substrate-binding protein [Acidimicrobiia bacterium]
MIKRWKLLTAVFAVLALVAGACGGDDAGSDTTVAPTTTTQATTTTTVADTTTTTAASGDTTTTTAPPVVRADADLVIWADDTRTPVIRPFAEAFGADNGLTVAVQELGSGDIRDRLITADPAGEGPDIIVGAHDWLGQLVANGVVAPIDIADISDTFSDVAVSAFTYEGKTYGVPYAVESIALIRNTDLVPTAPATFEELETIALGLRDDGTVTVPLALQENGNGDPFHNYPLVTALGGYVFGSPELGYDPNDLGLDSPGGLKAAEAFGAWSESGLVNIDVTYDVMLDSFGSGDAPFAITGPWAVSSFGDVNYVVEPIPPVQGGTPAPFVGVQGFMVATNAANPLIAETFLLDVMAGEEAQLALYEAGNRAPANLAAFAVASEDPDVQGFGLSSANGFPMPAIPEMGSVWSAWTDAYELIFTGTDPQTAFKDAAAQIRNLIAGG